MTMVERLPQPATSFNTSGHILGNDSFLNASFLTRLLMTNHGLHPETREGSDIVIARERCDKILAQWGDVCSLVNKLGKWDDWIAIRDANHDEKALSSLLQAIPI